MTSEERVKVVNDIDDILGDWTNSGDDFYLQQAMAAIRAAVVNVQSKYGEEAAMKELMGMMTEAAQQYCEETKKAAEKHEVLN